jgi:hypothetical protein
MSCDTLSRRPMKNNTRRNCNMQCVHKSYMNWVVRKNMTKSSSFLRCCLCPLNDPKDASKLNQMLSTCMK